MAIGGVLMDSPTLASYLRVASLSIAIFDFVQSVPAVWRLYMDQFMSKRFLLSCVLLALLQFTSISVLTISNVGWFAHFTHEDCLKFWMVPLIFKVCQAMVSQAIIGIRAYSLSLRSRRVGWILFIFYAFSCTLQWFTTLYQRGLARETPERNCLTVSSDVAMGAWVYYLVAMLYDTVVTAVSIGYLLKYKTSAPSCTVVSRLTTMMLHDGLGYLAVLSASNVFNLIFYFPHAAGPAQDVQTAAVSVGYAVTWIMSQRLVTHLHGAYTESRSKDATRAIPTPPAFRLASCSTSRACDDDDGSC